MQQKIRINDLARELEVKSKAILDVLPQVGVTEKKTHSSSIEVDEAVRVREFFAAQRQTAHSAEKRAARGPAEPEIKTKFDLSKISRPGDVLKAITQQQHPEPARPPLARPTPPPAAVPPKPAAPPTAAKPAAPAVVPPPPSPAKPVAPPAEEMAPPMVVSPIAPPRTAAPPPVLTTPPELVTPPPMQEEAAEAPEAVASVPPMETPEESEIAPPVVAAPPAAKKAPAVRTQPQAPPRRVITPQTGPRPVYMAAPPKPEAPPRPPVPGQPIASRPGMQGRPAPGRPVPGQPIFQRPRPAGAPSGPRPPLRPGERRPMHPTRAMPTGRPLGVGPGLPPPAPGRPAGRPGGPARRPGQRYVPRGVKEGPMKGFVPPPRLGALNAAEPLPITRSITITEGISVKDLAERLGVRAKEVIARLLARGVFASINQTLDASLANDMARQFGAETSVISFEEQAAQEMVEAELKSEETTGLVTRPPVVTIMGHVDHGKTTLLDSIRSTDVAGGEAGGITQHIGAYKVSITDPNSPAFGREITFLDTPGHEAFTRMRARGAKVTDIVVLVVAADDGVMPQTLEAIDHANAAKVPIIVAVNKIDKPGALPDRVKKQLGDRGLVPEDWGGKTVFVDVSAKQKTNLNLLLEMICLVADLQDLKANPERPATGSVVEAKLDRGRGAVATILVQDGTLKAGESFIVGNTFGKVRAMFDDRGNQVDDAPPSSAVEILGLEGLPHAGDQLVVVADRAKAKQMAQYREQKAREAQLAKSSRVSLEGLAEQLKTAGVKELPIILKGDVQGSVEVLADSLGKLSTDKVKIKILHSSVGAITETDVLLASASNAIIIGFSVRPERKAQEIAEQENVDIRLHSIIYELQDEIKKAMTGLLEPVVKETYLGRAEVRETFRIPKVGTVAGCYVNDGLIKRDSEVRLVRDGVQVFKGKVSSLRRFKDDASEVHNGLECGIAIANYGDVKVGDVIEAFVTERVAAEVMA
ncbi:MAG: translation initiation factor IF-2 [Acidobacteriia bacterium]|nr:translation initiation factor IF-2 [Terriglobia bacterium]